MYTEREPYLATTGTDSCWQTWHNSTVQRLNHRQTRSHGEEGWKDAYEDNKRMIAQCECATFSKSLNPRNIDKSVSDIRFRIRFPFESKLWISVSGCKLTILPDIQPANRIVIISGREVRNFVWHRIIFQYLFAVSVCWSRGNISESTVCAWSTQWSRARAGLPIWLFLSQIMKFWLCLEITKSQTKSGFFSVRKAWL